MPSDRDWVWHNRTVTPHDRAGSLKVFLSALALGVLLASSVSAQYLEATIMLPDTLGPLNGPYCLACTDDSAFPRLYIGGAGGFYPGRPPEDSGGVIVANALTCKRLARIPTGPAKALCYVPNHNKLYVSCLTADSVQVVDCATNEVVSAIRVAGRIPVMLYNSRNDRLYCGGDSVAVINCSADTVLHTISVAATCFALDSPDNKLYAGSSALAPLTVIDCVKDSVVAALPEIRAVGALCYNATAGKTYATSGYRLYVVAARGDSIVATIDFSGQASQLACDQQRNRVYCVYTGHWASIDCSADTVLLSYNLGLTPAHMTCNAARDLVYTTYSSFTPELDMFDGTTGQFLVGIGLDGQSAGMLWSTGLGRLFCEPQATGCLLASVGGPSERIDGIVPLRMRADEICVDTVRNRLYFLYSSDAGCVGSVDCARRVVTSYTYVGISAQHGCYNESNDRLYFRVRNDGSTRRDTLVVFDCAADSVVKRTPLGGEEAVLRLHPALNKLYAFTMSDSGPFDNIDVFACGPDSLIKRIPLPPGDFRAALLSPECDRLCYLAAEYAVTIDCRGDSILADTAAGLGTEACVSAEDRRIFASTWAGSTLRVLDIDSLSLLGTVPPFPDVSDDVRFAYVPNAHKVYWCAGYWSLGHSVVRVLDSRTNVILATFTTPREVAGVCLDHTGRYVYCASWDDWSFFVIDTRVDSVVATVQLPSLPTAYNPLVPNARTGRVYVAQWAVSNLIPVIRDSIVIGLNERASTQQRWGISPTLVRRSVPLRAAVPAGVFDASGRRTAALRPGLNDITHLAPGIYFVREEPLASNHRHRAVRKLVVAR